MAYSKIKEVTTEFDALDFYQNRTLINQRITSELSALFLNQSGGVLNVTQVQVRQINVDPTLETAIESKLIQMQSQKSWETQRTINLLLKKID